MLNIMEVHETNKMIEQEKLDVRTITMGISLLDCAADSVDEVCENIYNKITTYAKDLVSTGQAIERDFGIPIVNKRITVTPISLVGASSCKSSEDFVKIAHALDRAAKKVGVDLIGGYSALVSKSMTPAEEMLIRSLPQALSETDIVCSSVNVGSTKTGIDMNSVELLGHIIKDIAHATADNDSYGCVKFVAFCNAPDDNPFMAGGFHGVPVYIADHDGRDGIAGGAGAGKHIGKPLGAVIELVVAEGGHIVTHVAQHPQLCGLRFKHRLDQGAHGKVTAVDHKGVRIFGALRLDEGVGAGKAADLREGAALAAESIDSGKARDKLAALAVRVGAPEA